MGLTGGTPDIYEEDFAKKESSKGKSKEDGDDDTVSPTAGNLTGTLDTTDVGAGEGALLQSVSSADFGVSPTHIDGADPTDGENPLFAPTHEPLTEDDSADAKKAAKQREADEKAAEKEAEEKRAAREEEQSAEEAGKQRDSQGNPSDTEPAPGVAVEAASAEKDAERREAQKAKDDKANASKEAGTYDPAEHTAPEVVEYLKNADKSEVTRVKREERKRRPEGRKTILDFKPEK